MSLSLKKALIDRADLEWALRGRAPLPAPQPPPVSGRECGVLGRSLERLESKAETGKVESEPETDLEEGREGETQRQN